jgi:hypothetical protein
MVRARSVASPRVCRQGKADQSTGKRLRPSRKRENAQQAQHQDQTKARNQTKDRDRDRDSQ